MKQADYTFAMFFLGLTVVCGLTESIIHFHVGQGIYFLQTFAHWFLAVNIISLIGTVFVLAYLREKKYVFAFWAGVVASGLLLCMVVINYVILIFVLREIQPYALLWGVPYLISSISFAAALVFTQAGERRWIKIAGVFTLMICTVIASAVLARFLSPAFASTRAFAQIEQWIALGGSLVPVFFILNFRSELRSRPRTELARAPSTPWDTVSGALAMVSVLAVLVLGLQVAKESYWNVSWQREAPAGNEALVKDFETGIYVNRRGDTLRYLFRRPFEYDPAKKYPIVVCLHGGPVRERKIEVAQPAPFLVQSENERRYRAFLFVPQAPPGHTWGGVPRLPSVDSLVFETMASLEAEFSIDASRRYVVGASMGGFGTWYFIGSRPETFAAAMPLCGDADPKLAMNMVATPVWAFHGSVDRNVSVRASRKMIKAIREAGGNPLYTEFPGVGHNVWPDVSKTPGLMDWLFAQKRDATLVESRVAE